MRNSTTKKIAVSWCWLLRLVLPWRVRYYAKCQNPLVILKWMDGYAICRSSDGAIYHLYLEDVYDVKYITGRTTN